MSSLVTFLSMSFAHFMIGFFVSLLLILRSSLSIFETNPLSDTSFANIFSHSEGCLLVLLTVSFAVALSGIYPKDTDAMKRRDTCTPMFIAAMSTVAKLWKEPRCPWKDEWLKKMWFMYTMEYYSAIRNDKYPSFASMWMDLEGIMLSEVSQLEKDKHCMV